MGTFTPVVQSEYLFLYYAKIEEMREAYAVLGVGFLVIIIGVLFFTHPQTPSTHSMLTISSSAFSEAALIPAKYTCDSSNVSPPLSISGVPAEAKSLVLIMDDPDIPQAVKDSMHINVFVHWVVFNIPPDTKVLPEGAKPAGIEGSNGVGKAAYTGPCPPDREHRYFFKLFALDTVLSLTGGVSRQNVEKAMEGHVIGSAELVGLYNRPQNLSR